MVILDEQLQGEGLEEAIGKWYPGSIVSITTLRPNTIIKDASIPGLLAQQSRPIFVTINVTDFWQRLPLQGDLCLVCFVMASTEIDQIPASLRRLLRHDGFDTKAKRAGKAVPITAQGTASRYSASDGAVRPLDGF